MKIRVSALASAGALACFLAPAAHAADAQLGHVVVTATRQPISAVAALASVDVFERDEIARAGHSSLLGLLSSRPGVQMARNGGPGSSGSIFIRGANSGTHAAAGRWGAHGLRHQRLSGAGDDPRSNSSSVSRSCAAPAVRCTARMRSVA